MPVEIALARLEEMVPGGRRDAVVLFGSYARGEQHAKSDMDLLVIGRRSQKLYRKYPEATLDVVVETPAVLRRQLEEVAEWNNHFLINLLSRCVILEDASGIARELVERAKEKYLLGPPAMGREDARKAVRALRTMYRSAKGDPERFNGDAEHCLLYKMRLDQVVSRSIYLYFRATRNWAGSFPWTVGRLQTLEPEFYRLWQRYAHASLPRAGRSANRIVRFTCESLRKVSC